MANQSLLREFFKHQAVPATLLKAAGSWAHKQDVIESWLDPSHWVRPPSPVWLLATMRPAQPAALQDTTHIAVEARNLSVSMAELVRADGVRGTAVAEVTGDAYGPQAPTVKPCRRLLRTRLRAQ
jgi:hypothetical protein